MTLVGHVPDGGNTVLSEKAGGPPVNLQSIYTTLLRHIYHTTKCQSSQSDDKPDLNHNYYWPEAWGPFDSRVGQDSIGLLGRNLPLESMKHSSLSSYLVFQFSSAANLQDIGRGQRHYLVKRTLAISRKKTIKYLHFSVA